MIYYKAARADKMEHYHIARCIDKVDAAPSETPIVLMMCEGNLCSEMPVTRSLDNIQRISLLDKVAIENTEQELVPIMAPLATMAILSMTSDNLVEELCEINMLAEENPKYEASVFMITDKYLRNGVTVLFVGDTLDKVGKIIGENFYVLCPTNEDALIMPSSIMSAETMRTQGRVFVQNETANNQDKEFMNCIFEYDINDKMLHIFESWERQ